MDMDFILVPCSSALPGRCPTVSYYGFSPRDCMLYALVVEEAAKEGGREAAEDVDFNPLDGIMIVFKSGKKGKVSGDKVNDQVMLEIDAAPTEAEWRDLQWLVGHYLHVDLGERTFLGRRSEMVAKSRKAQEN